MEKYSKDLEEFMTKLVCGRFHRSIEEEAGEWGISLSFKEHWICRILQKICRIFQIKKKEQEEMEKNKKQNA